MSAEELAPTGPAAAAILAAGAGSLALGVLAFVGDAWPAAARSLDVWDPSGPLSGVTFSATIAWLVIWVALHRVWRRREINLAPINAAAFAMLAGGILLTFPPFADLLQGR